MPDNPLLAVAPVDPKLDRRHDRGALDTEEFEALIRATPVAEPFRGLTDEDRALLYLVAPDTGLRAAELAGLTPTSFALGDAPAVRVRCGHTKNRQEAVLPLRDDLAVRSWRLGLPTPRSGPDHGSIAHPGCSRPTW